MGIALRPTKSGAIIFDVAKHTLDEAAEASEELQVLYSNICMPGL